MWGVLPNIDYSPLLDAAWWLLQFAFKWAGFLCVLVFLLVLVMGAGDLLVEALWGKRNRPGKEPTSRTKE